MALTTVQDLRTHLQWAAQVELTTIPTYLYAMYPVFPR
ncbi:MAG: ferritin-like domain-containing protein [SAR202 cluster bacterium]|nr:ferritin-like domain-containing protein [SAR202 cluster bacterium]